MVIVMVKNTRHTSRWYSPTHQGKSNRKNHILLNLILCSLYILPFFVKADVKINEFSPESSPQTVELYNNASESADISGWYIDDDGGSSNYFTIPPKALLYPQSCLVISSNLNLNKSTPDSIRLFDSSFPPASSSAHLIDVYSYKGSPGQDYSYGRNPDGQENWLIISSSFGKYNTNNQNCIITPTTLPSHIPTNVPTPSPSHTPTSIPESYDNILISEVMVYPDSTEQEWIEFYNNNEFEVVLENWFIDDTENSGSALKTINLIIPPYSFAAYDLTSPMFNNDGDSVRLLDYYKLQKDGFEYGASRQNTTYSRVSWTSDSFCETSASKYGENNACLYPTKQPYINYSSSTPRLLNQFISPYHHSQDAFSTEHKKTTSYSPSVLGTTTHTTHQNITPNSLSPLPHLSFLSMSYTILTIASILIKIKNAF